MRRDLVMAGQPYLYGGEVVRADVVHRSGVVVLADGRSCQARSLARTPDKRPGSRTRSEPWRARCATCDAPAGVRCRTRSGNVTAYHEPRLHALATKRSRSASPHAPTTVRSAPWASPEN